jgi:hypothetical protein
MLLVRAANTALVVSTPAMASFVAFLAYAGFGHQLTPVIIFSSLTWFQLLRVPLMMLRRLPNRPSYPLRVLILSRYSSVVEFYCRRAKCDWSSPGVFHCGDNFFDACARSETEERRRN